MSFDLETWKEKIGDQLKKVGHWLDRRSSPDARLLYGYLAGMSLFPLAAAAQSGEFVPVVMALGSIAAGVGGNLIANQIQKWVDRGQPVTEQDVIEWAAEQSATNPEFRQAADEILDKLKVIEQVQAGLSPQQQQQFRQILQAELQQLGNLNRFEVHLSGVGNVIQGQGNFAVTNTGSGPTFGQVQGDVYLTPPPADPAQARRQEARQRYLTALRRHCQVLPLAALGGEEGADEDLSLDQVYIDLDTTYRVPLTEQEKAKRRKSATPKGLEREAEERLLTALEAAAQTPRLALLGEPGAGKSTFVRKLIGWQAAALLGESQPAPGCTASLLPILLTLRDLAPRLDDLDLAALSGEAQKQALAKVVQAQYLAELARLDVAELADELRLSLTGGECLLVLDGLDEVPQALRQRVRLATAAVISLYRAKRIIITCRVRSYVGETIVPNFQAFTLAPFSADKLRAFTRAWYQAQQALGRVETGQVMVKADDLAKAALTKELRELAENPMLLTTMALIHQKEIGLPHERVRLYSLAVEVLLQRWQKRKSGESGLSPSAALAGILQDNLRLRQVVERLAYEAQRAGQGQRQAADLPRGEALLLLEQAGYLGQTALADEFLDYADQRAGLLVGRGGEVGRPTTYSFPHRTFQEYLAGCYLVSRRNAARGFYERAGEGDIWALAAQLGSEELLYNLRRTADVLDLAYQLCPLAEPTGEQARRAVLWSGQMAALIGVEAIRRDSDGPEEGTAYLQRLIPRLIGLLESELSAPERVEAGRVLAHLGDPRPGVGLRPDDLPDIVWCEVPAGPFVMGSDKTKDKWANDNEQPLHKIDVPAFRISRCLITQTQFHAFSADDGYQEAGYWAAAAAAGYWRKGKVKRITYRFEGNDLKPEEEWATVPVDFGPKYSLDNHPVVGINWFEAVAFCHWLTTKLRTAGELDPKQSVTLPSERQWEKAARGSDGRVYPWGSEADSNRGNYLEAGIGATSAVGCFPDGTSPYGCLDMSGNVSEWCRTRWQDSYENYWNNNNDLKGHYRRVLRGGAFDDNAKNVRCAFRSDFNPYYWDYSIGFRVVVSSFS